VPRWVAPYGDAAGASVRAACPDGLGQGGQHTPESASGAGAETEKELSALFPSGCCAVPSVLDRAFDGEL
jgi:hypothetical protein